MKFLFICVHPDDLEFNCSNLITYLTSTQHSVNILCLTQGEFGIFLPEWKGPRLAKIRKNELIQAAKINGVSPENVYFGNVVDGFVIYDLEHLNYLLEWLNKLQPDIIFAPEAYFTYYWHSDHINCGRLANYIFKKKQSELIKPIKALYFYTSVKPNIYWPFQDVNQALKALSKHQSQWWLLKWVNILYPFEKRMFFNKNIGKWKFAERYRRVFNFQGSPTIRRLLKTILAKISISHTVNPPKDHYVVPNANSSFGQKVSELRRKYKYD